MRLQMPDPVPRPGPIPVEDPPPNDPPVEIPPEGDPVENPMPVRVAKFPFSTCGMPFRALTRPAAWLTRASVTARA